MSKILPRLFAVAAMGLTCAAAASADSTVATIYGEDDRREVYQVPPEIRKLADSTVALIVSPAVHDYVFLHTILSADFSREHQLCEGEAFDGQRITAYCSGALVAPDLVLTTAGCMVDQRLCERTKFVFGWDIRKEGGKPPTWTWPSEVYGCSALVASKRDDKGADYALVRLDRPVRNHAPLAVNRSGVIADGTPIFMIGNPNGLPTKVAGNAHVRDAGKQGFFTANLDAFSDNAGSPVFNAKTLEIEGILARGMQDSDYVLDPEKKCYRPRKFPDDGGPGEEVTKVSEVLSQIPQPPSAPRRLGESMGGAVYSDLVRAAGEKP